MEKKHRSGVMFSSIYLCFLLFHFYYTPNITTATVPISSPTDTLNSTESITDDGQIVVSAGSNFALGFFSPGNSSYRYVGIWYHKVPETTTVWVANRDNPLNDSSGVLCLDLDGNLVLSSRRDQRHPLWSTDVYTSSNITVLQLLNTGNLVLYSGGNRNTILWQSFDHPTHTWLPGMKLGLDWKTGLNRSLTSWKSKDDPSRGTYSFRMDPRGSPQPFLYKGSAPLWRAGPWNGQSLSGVPLMYEEDSHWMRYNFVDTKDELCITYDGYNSSSFISVFIDYSGALQLMMWSKNRWNTVYKVPGDKCGYNGHCGANGVCQIKENTVECSCLPGFQPKSPIEWNLTEWSEGCVRKRNLGCDNGGDGFLKLEGVKLPDSSTSVVDMNLNLMECKHNCLKNCSCTAYAPADITGGGSGCIAWFDNLMDIRHIPYNGQDLYLRVDAVELGAQKRKDKEFIHNKRRLAILTVSLAVGVPLFVAFVHGFQNKRKGATGKQHRRFLTDFITGSRSNANFSGMNGLDENGTNLELPYIELDVIAAATDNFSPNNKLGEGGFGAVYKGLLSNGKEIAVKRLSKNSEQGMKEFKTEALLIAKLQHRNLVRLLACSLQEEEKILVYEYMPNKSLDSFIFDKTKSGLLDWRKRLEIIVGIARGVLYLHQDSRLKIIHRGLKASNVLPVENMNPKISDFGLARMFGRNQSQANTNKVVGTYGYMPPEYAMQGLFSTKLDVFSFGVLLLEIISGKKNNARYSREHPSTNLIEHVWDLWREGTALEIVGSSMGGLYPTHEVSRSIQVGLLCVQESASDRPTMSSATFMLENETTIPMPNQPALILKRTIIAQDSSTSINEVTIIEVEPR